ncbi:MAG TPA: asparagine synthetase A [Thermoplasmata archaeon]|nr:asparagine synthetase A [Thermoplasmata archaeon]
MTAVELSATRTEHPMTGSRAPAGVERALDHLDDATVRDAVVVGSEVRHRLGQFLHARRFVEIAPVIVAPVTDPLNHPVSDPRIDYYGHSFQLTRSMIFHKQLALRAVPRVYCFSPNLRFEPVDRQRTGRHLVEFTQLDLEMRGASREDAMALGERLLADLVRGIRTRCAAELERRSRTLPALAPPFPQIAWRAARRKWGPSFEADLSKASRTPVWLIDIPLPEREFYDREDAERPGILRDMDLIYPDGFGEALSGGEREYTLEAILRRIRAKGQTPEQFRWYLESARRGLEPSAGFGIGLERLVRWLLGLRDVADTSLFPKRIGEWSL